MDVFVQYAPVLCTHNAMPTSTADFYRAFFFGLKLTRMSRPLRSLTLVKRLSTARCHHALRPSHPSLHLRCGGVGASYATQAHERVHPHHLPAQKPSVFGQPTAKSHPHLGEQHPCVRHPPPPPPPLALVCGAPSSRRISFADGGTRTHSQAG